MATIGYIDWVNYSRLRGEITDDNTCVTPAEFESSYYVKQHPPTRRSLIDRALTETAAVQDPPPSALDDSIRTLRDQHRCWSTTQPATSGE